MKDDEKILLPVIKCLPPLMFICGALLFLGESDFLRRPMNDYMVIIALVFWVVIVLASLVRYYVSADGLEVRLLGVPIRRVPAEKISYIEVVRDRWMRIVFEIGDCTRCCDTKPLYDPDYFYLKNMFKTVTYTPPEKQLEEVLELLNTLFPSKVGSIKDAER